MDAVHDHRTMASRRCGWTRPSTRTASRTLVAAFVAIAFASMSASAQETLNDADTARVVILRRSVRHDAVAQPLPSSTPRESGPPEGVAKRLRALRDRAKEARSKRSPQSSISHRVPSGVHMPPRRDVGDPQRYLDPLRVEPPGGGQ